MITIEKTMDFPLTYPLERLGRPEDILFFDIETTGFSAEYSTLYLIGCAYLRADSWRLIQWFADDLASERQVLMAFFQFLKDFSILLHFNGDGFDIPYLQKRCGLLHIECDFSGKQSIDIYKKIKPYKKLLGLDSLKQKAIEQFLRISRKDLYSGGQLIEVYHDYLITGEDSLFHMLMLHNEDDLKGMPAILPILQYPDFFESNLTFLKKTCTCETDVYKTCHHTLSLTYQSNCLLPVPFSHHHDFVCLCGQGQQLTLEIQLYNGTLKYYYPNYKDYYYLIFEDKAIHKSVAEYVDRQARKKATADTCYTTVSGCFLPQPTPFWQPALKTERKAKRSYVEYTDQLFTPKQAKEYMDQLLISLKL